MTGPTARRHGRRRPGRRQPGTLRSAWPDAVRTGHAFLDDIAHTAAPRRDAGGLAPDADDVAGGPVGRRALYDNELLDAHYIAGDGRVNENIGLTTVHHIFHSEHNRLVEQTKDVVLARPRRRRRLPQRVAARRRSPRFPTDLSTPGVERRAPVPGGQVRHRDAVPAPGVRGVRAHHPAADRPVLRADRRSTTSTINPSIVAEFAHTVYRFGHSMLTETVDRLDPELRVAARSA